MSWPGTKQSIEHAAKVQQIGASGKRLCKDKTQNIVI